jgi:hypothetical protein
VLTEVTAEATREDRLGFLGREFESKRNWTTEHSYHAEVEGEYLLFILFYLQVLVILATSITIKYSSLPQP